MKPSKPYELYYWPSIQGRGEFVRLALEEAAIPYRDMARETRGKGVGVAGMMRLLEGKAVTHPSFAPPFLKIGSQIIGQTADILLFLGARHRLAPKNDAGSLWTHQLQLTIADWVQEVHDTHHPVASNLFYEDQKPEAKRKAKDFRGSRLAKFMGYFEQILAHNPASEKHLVGRVVSYADLSLFQMVEGLRYAFPRAMKRIEPAHPRVIALHDAVAERPNIASYLESDRRIPFNQEGIFRRYKKLDA